MVDSWPAALSRGRPGAVLEMKNRPRKVEFDLGTLPNLTFKKNVPERLTGKSQSHMDFRGFLI